MNKTIDVLIASAQRIRSTSGKGGITESKIYSVLSTDELRKAQTYKSHKARELFVLSRAMLRSFAANIQRKEAKQIAIELSTSGKPFFPTTKQGDTVYFNISHAWPHAVLAFTRAAECGVDIEMTQQGHDWEKVASLVLHPKERSNNALRPSTGGEFIKLWTRKEAASKAIGRGLSWDFSSFRVCPESGQVISNEGRHPITVCSFESAPHASPKGWVSVACTVPPPQMPSVRICHISTLDQLGPQLHFQD